MYICTYEGNELTKTSDGFNPSLAYNTGHNTITLELSDPMVS